MTNQSTINNTHIANAPEEEMKMTNKITCTHCGIEMTYHTDYIEVRNSDGAFLGNIYSADPAEDWERLQAAPAQSATVGKTAMGTSAIRMVGNWKTRSLPSAMELPISPTPAGRPRIEKS